MRSICQGSGPPPAPGAADAASRTSVAQRSRVGPGDVGRHAVSPGRAAGAQTTGEFEQEPAAHAVRGDRQPLGRHRVERMVEHHPGQGVDQGQRPIGRVEVEAAGL